MEQYNLSNPLFMQLKKELKNGSKLSIVAASFSIYAYEILKNELDKIEEFRFLYPEPTFVSSIENKERREFYIPRLSREKSIYGTEFEMKLKNELTQKSIAKECSDWIREKARFKSNNGSGKISPLMILENRDNTYLYQPFDGFTLEGLMAEKDDSLIKFSIRHPKPFSESILDEFESIWNDKNINVNWPIVGDILLSEKDMNHRTFTETFNV